MSEGPFTDDFVRHGLLTVQTQRGIIEYAEAMAQVLAEAGAASHKANGDPADYAIRRWSDVILKRALEIEREKLTAQNAPTLHKLAAMENLLEKENGDSS